MGQDCRFRFVYIDFDLDVGLDLDKDVGRGKVILKHSSKTCQACAHFPAFTYTSTYSCRYLFANTYCTTLPWRFVWKKTLFSWTCVYMHMKVYIFGQTKTVHIFLHVFICSLQTCTNSFIYIKIFICTFANILTPLSWFQRKSKHILLNSFVFTSSCICIYIHISSQIHARTCVFGFKILHRSKYSFLLSYIYSCRKMYLTNMQIDVPRYTGH